MYIILFVPGLLLFDLDYKLISIIFQAEDYDKLATLRFETRKNIIRAYEHSNEKSVYFVLKICPLSFSFSLDLFHDRDSLFPQRLRASNQISAESLQLFDYE